ncbi:MAG: hypothetical protein DMF63_09080 [Acidobacteria bacterium]|nr:MAG: hypothetical protein DMF63_09080 [Acidobacteriota bacterium]
MTRSFNCASCSAPLEFEGTPIQKCRYCGGTVVVPRELFYSSDDSPFLDLDSLTGRAQKIAEINQLLHDGQKIEAIKVFREAFGVGLQEAKDAIDRMAEGRSLDISGMRIVTSRAATPADLEKVKKIGYTIGGSILATVIGSILIVGGMIIAIFYFTWSMIDKKIPNVSNITNTSTTPIVTTSREDRLELLKIGGEGNGEGHFKDNRHVAVDGRGRIYSSDYSPHRIQVFDADGKFLNQWNPETGSNLYDLVADRDGNVYLANDKGIFKHEGESGKVIARSTNVYPRAIALTWDGKIIAAAGKSIVVLDNSLKLVKEFKDAAESANSTFGFEKIATDGDGVIYALDTHGNDICKFSADGKFLNRFASGANAPHALAVDPRGRLFVSDTNMIYVLDANGQIVGSFDTRQAFGIAFDKAGDLFIASRPYVLKRKLSF